MKLSSKFYQGNNAVTIAKNLIGKTLISNIDGNTTGGIIIETEAYCAPLDKASHAFNNRRTKRTETMFMPGGVAYVYLCYGLHNLFNIVTGPKDLPHAVLIRAIKPTVGIEHILTRRKATKLHPKISSGPGTVCSALGITREHDNISLIGNTIWIEDQKVKINKNNILSTPRIGINYAKEYINKPWRFVLNHN